MNAIQIAGHDPSPRQQRRGRNIATARKSVRKKIIQNEAHAHVMPVPLTHKESFVMRDGVAVLRGDTVWCDKLAGEYRFIDITTNHRNGKSWVSLFNDREGFRYVEPDEICRSVNHG